MKKASLALPKKKNIFDCAVIGAGPGGLMTALYLKRYWRSVVIFDAKDSRLVPVPKIKTLPGYEDGLSGVRFLTKLERQVQSYKPLIIRETAQVKRKGKRFLVVTPHHKIRARKVVIACGMKDRQPQIPNFRKLCQQGLLAYCPVCEGFDHRQKDIAILVHSASCLGKIKFIAYYSDHVHLIMPRRFKWPRSAIHFFEKRKIQMSYGGIEYIKRNSKNGRLKIKLINRPEFEVQMAYVEMGSDVHADFIKGLRQDKNGFIYVDTHQRTSLPGVFAVGDCVKSLSQIVVALGHAAIAATQIHNDLLSTENNDELPL